MASPNTLALRARMDRLGPTEIRLAVQPTPRTAVKGDFADSLRITALNADVRRQRARAAVNGKRDIPTSGPGRRRAKAQRNKRAATGLLTDVLAYCDAYPHRGPLPGAEELILHRSADGSITVEGSVPDVIDVSCDLLDWRHLRGMDFVNGALVLRVKPSRLRYRPLGRCPHLFAVRFQRIADET